MKTLALNWQLIRAQPTIFGLHSVFHLLFNLGLIALGLIEKWVFDSLSGDLPIALNIWTLIGLYASVGLVRLLTSFPDIWYAYAFRRKSRALIQHNLLAAQLRRPGAVGLPVTTGEAVGRYDNDVAEICDFPTWFPHVLAEGLTFVLAVAIMAWIDWVVTLVVFVPLVLTIVLARVMWARLLLAWEAAGAATDRVKGMLGELFGAVQAIKVAGSEDDVIQHFDAINQARGRTEVHTQVLNNIVFSFHSMSATLALGIVLLLVGGRMSAGAFTVGEFALFVSYIWYTAGFPSLIGSFIGDYQQQAVAIRRLGDLLPGETSATLVMPAVWPEAAPAAQSPRTGNRPILEVRQLSFRYPGGGGIEDINLALEPGSFTVITGKIGSGKTTLLRAILGLLPHQNGQLFWYDQPVDDPTSFFKPPRTAYTSQTPRLFSDTLRENILLGWSDQKLGDALHQSVLAYDLATLSDGLETVVGPRGMRLSGGQLQRSAAARMFVRNAELLVFDDLSSALDVETEQLLWQRLGQDKSCLVVSHRRAALRRASQIIVLHEGRMIAQGTLHELLAAGYLEE